MRSFLIQDDDLVIEKGNLLMIDEDEQKCQAVERALTTRKGEFFLNIEHGLDYTEFKRKNPDLEKIKMDVIEAALQEESLKSIEKIDIDFDRQRRAATITFIGKLKNGGEIKGEVNV